MSDEQQPVAWAAVWPDDGDGVDCNWIYSSREDAEWAALKGDNIDGRRGVGTVIPLYRQPQPTLTDEEREAVRFCVTASLPETEKLGGVAGELCRLHAATLRALLERLGGGA